MSNFLQLITGYINDRSEGTSPLKRRLNEIKNSMGKKENIETTKRIIEENKKEFVIEKKKEDIDITVFWRKIDIEIVYTQLQNMQEYNFRGYFFPKTIESSFLALEDEQGKIVFDRGVIFHNAHFLDEITFNFFIFNGKVGFNSTHFHDIAKITHCRFEGETYFRQTIFNREVDFNSSRFENVTLDSITFPENENIKMIRTSFEKVIWSNFINSNDVSKIESERETFARLKQANSERGNFIDSNLFFVEESNMYLKDSIYKFLCNPYNKKNLRCPSLKKKMGFFGDVISFGIAKITSNFGQSWITPLSIFFTLFFLATFLFEPNVDFVSTETTPKFILKDNPEAEDEEKIEEIAKKYFQKNYYSEYTFDFQESGNLLLKENFTTRLMYVYGSLAPTLMSSSQWFSTIKYSKFFLRNLFTILFWYFLGAFIYALKNRTRRV